MHLEEGSCFELARGNVFSPIQPREDFMIKTALLHSTLQGGFKQGHVCFALSLVLPWAVTSQRATAHL